LASWADSAAPPALMPLMLRQAQLEAQKIALTLSQSKGELPRCLLLGFRPSVALVWQPPCRPGHPADLWTKRQRRTICKAPFQRKPPMFLLARDRALIALTGADRQAYLQGLVSND